MPFDRHFSPDEQDTGLKKTFRKYGNLSGIFNWLLQGYALLQSDGLAVPARITAAIEEYRRGSNGGGGAVGEFIADMLVASVGNSVKTSALYDCYKMWARDCGYNAVRVQDFVGELRKRLEVKHDSVLGNIAVGVAIKSNDKQNDVSDVSALSKPA